MPRLQEPKAHEPIRRVETAKGNRYRAVLDVSAKGSPRKQVTRTFDSLQEARYFVTETRARIAAGTFSAPNKLTLRDLAEDWLQSRNDIRTKSLRGYADVLRPILVRLGHRPVQGLTRRDVDDLVKWLGSEGRKDGGGYGHRSIVYALGTLKQVLAYGVVIGVLPSNPAQGVKAPRRKKGDRKIVVPWEPDELLRFRAVADEQPLAGVWRLTLCGLRRSEVLGLSWDDVDFDAGTVHVGWSRVLVGDGRATERDDTKSRASERTIRPDDVHAGTMALLRVLRAQQAANQLGIGPAYANAERLVAVNELGEPLDPNTFSAQFAVLCDQAAVRRIGIHTVRHTVARIMHSVGVTPADAAAFLGHTLAVHLSVYVVLTQRGADAAGRALGAALAIGA